MNPPNSHSHRHHTQSSQRKDRTRELKQNMVENAFNLSSNFTQSKMYLFFKRLSVFFCCCSQMPLQPSVWPKGTT